MTGLPRSCFERFEHRQGRHAGAAEEHRLGLRPVDRAGQAVGALGGLVVDVGDPLQVFRAHHRVAVRFEMGACPAPSSRPNRARHSASRRTPSRSSAATTAPNAVTMRHARCLAEARQQRGLALAAEIVAGRGMRDDDDVRLDRRQHLDAAIEAVDHRAVRRPGRRARPGCRRGIMRWKCSDTPAGASAIISALDRRVSRRHQNPSRALHPIIAYLRLDWPRRILRRISTRCFASLAMTP